MAMTDARTKNEVVKKKGGKEGLKEKLFQNDLYDSRLKPGG